MQQDQTFVVGTPYEVPCISVGEFNGVFVPIHLPIHSDPELGAPQPHVHIDLRFLCLPDVVRSLTGADGRRHCPGHGLCFNARKTAREMEEPA